MLFLEVTMTEDCPEVFGMWLLFMILERKNWRGGDVIVEAARTLVHTNKQG